MNPRPRPAPPLPELPFGDADAGSHAPPAAPAVHAPTPGQAWDHCPNCGGGLVNERCKRRCTRCHYFMSCSDFD